MTRCEHRMCGDANGLQCIREDHEDRGHSYEGSAGPDNEGHRHVNQEDVG